MSNRYNITLKNTKTRAAHYHQLFGNNDYFPTFEKYLVSIGAVVGQDFITDVTIPDLTAFIQAIDETVWHDIISKEPITESQIAHSFPHKKMHSPYLDFTSQLIMYNPIIKTPIVVAPIYQIASIVASQAYFFSSYNFINWLKQHKALKTDKIQFVKHNYVDKKSQSENPNDIGEPIIIGELKPQFELTISWG
jgi:hypothetical protein